MPEQIPNIESEKEGKINLSSLGFNFCSDKELESYYNNLLEGMADKDKWIEENKSKRNRNTLN